MKLVDSEINMLITYEERFRTAVFSDYSRNIISQDLEQLRLIYSKIIGKEYRLNKSCSTCCRTVFFESHVSNSIFNLPILSVIPSFATVSCLSIIKPHSEQCLPRVSPLFSQVGAAASSTTSV